MGYLGGKRRCRRSVQESGTYSGIYFEPLPRWFKASALALIWAVSFYYSVRPAIRAVEQFALYPAPEYEDWRHLAASAFVIALPWMVISVLALQHWLRSQKGK